MLHPTNKVFLAFIKMIADITTASLNIGLLANIENEQLWLVHLNVTLTRTEIFLTACYHYSHKNQEDRKSGNMGRTVETLMLRTKLHQNPFFFTVNQNVNRPRSRATRSVYGPIFLLFNVIIVSFIFFFLSRCKQNRIKLCYNRLQFVKETKISGV